MKRTRAKPAKSRAQPRGFTAEDGVALYLRSEGIAFEREHRFHPTRRWRFDLAIVEHRIAVEIHGQFTAIGGRSVAYSRHTSVKGFAADLEKKRAAALLGWRVLEFTAQEAKAAPGLVAIAVRELIDVVQRERDAG